MPKLNQQILAFNRGLISPLALGRIDLERTALSSEIDVNWMTRVPGSTRVRPGLFSQWANPSSPQAKLIPFVFSTSKKDLVEVTGSALRVWDGDSLVTRPSDTDQGQTGALTTDVSEKTDEDNKDAT